jgi:hypothetical protein
MVQLQNLAIIILLNCAKIQTLEIHMKKVIGRVIQIKGINIVLIIKI